MALRGLWRLLLATALIVATQSSLLHPFQHFHEAHGAQAVATVSSVGDRHPFEVLHQQLCEVCVAGAALGAAASSDSPAPPVFSHAERAASRRDGIFIAAFSPLFRSQAPPAFL